MNATSLYTLIASIVSALTAGACLGLWIISYRRRLRAYVEGAEARRAALKAETIEVIEHERTRCRQAIEAQRQLSARQATAEYRQIAAMSVLFASAVEAMEHRALAHESTPEGETAAIALYVAHMQGLWHPSGKSARLLSRGCTLASLRSVDRDRLIEAIRSRQESAVNPYKEST